MPPLERVPLERLSWARVADIAAESALLSSCPSPYSSCVALRFVNNYTLAGAQRRERTGVADVALQHIRALACQMRRACLRLAKICDSAELLKVAGATSAPFVRRRYVEAIRMIPTTKVEQPAAEVSPDSQLELKPREHPSCGCCRTP